MSRSAVETFDPTRSHARIAFAGAPADTLAGAEGPDAIRHLLDRAAVTYQVVLTKADGIKSGALARKQAEVDALVRKHAAAYPAVVTTSSETGQGIEALRAELAGLALPA